VLVELADTLREKHLIALLGNDRFRAQLDSGGKEALWQQLDELTTSGPIKGKEEKSFTLCPDHLQAVFKRPQAAQNVKGVCTYCDSWKHACDYGHSHNHNNKQQEVRSAWISK